MEIILSKVLMPNLCVLLLLSLWGQSELVQLLKKSHCALLTARKST